MAEFAVHIVTYNTKDLTLECIKFALQATKDYETEFVIVDNGSDGTGEAVRERYRRISIHSSPRNVGFGPGHNLAASRSTAPYFVVLNTDVVLTEAAVRSCVESLRGDQKIGTVSPQLVDSNGSLQTTCHSFPTARAQWKTALRLRGSGRLVTESQGFLSGACLFVRRQAFEEVGGFDERYRMYFEDADLAWRLRQLGWRQNVRPETRVAHIGGASGATDRRLLTAFAYRGRLQFVRDHLGVLSALSTKIGMRVEGATGKIVLVIRVLSGQISAEDRRVVSGITTDLLRLARPKALPSD